MFAIVLFDNNNHISQSRPTNFISLDMHFTGIQQKYVSLFKYGFYNDNLDTTQVWSLR